MQMTTPTQSAIFPCIEQPHRCLLSMKFNGNKRYLASNSDGSLYLSESFEQQGNKREEYQLLPVEKNGKTDKRTIEIRSVKHERSLVCFPGGRVGLSSETKDNEESAQMGIHGEIQQFTEWKMVKCGEDGVFLLTKNHDLDLSEGNAREEGAEEMETKDPAQLIISVSKDGNILTTKYSKEINLEGDNYVEWKIEFQTGELVFLSSPYSNKRIRCDISGSLSLSNNWRGWEVWRFVETGDPNGSVYITSFCHEKKFLCSDESGKVFTMEKQNKSSSLKAASTENENAKDNINNLNMNATLPSIGDKLSLWGQQQKKRMNASLAKRSEIFSRDGHSVKDFTNGYKIDQSNIKTNLTVEDLSKWIIQKAPISNETTEPPQGVIIKSVATGKNLRKSGNSIHTSLNGNVNFEVWDLQSANRQTYFLTTIGNLELNSELSGDDTRIEIDEKEHQLLAGRRIGINKRLDLYLSSIKNPIKQQSEEWRIEQCDDMQPGFVFFFCASKKMYLGSTEFGQLCCTSSNTSESTIWKVAESQVSEYGYSILSKSHNRYLAVNIEGTLCTIGSTSDYAKTSRVVWLLEPRLPRQVNSSKIKALAIASTAAIATTVAAPFVITGAVGLLGIAEVGVAAEIVAGVGLAAEAAASVAIVGSTARTLMHSAAVGTEEEDARKTIANRPFCAWRSW